MEQQDPAARNARRWRTATIVTVAIGGVSPVVPGLVPVAPFVLASAGGMAVAYGAGYGAVRWSLAFRRWRARRVGDFDDASGWAGVRVAHEQAYERFGAAARAQLDRIVDLVDASSVNHQEPDAARSVGIAAKIALDLAAEAPERSARTRRKLALALAGVAAQASDSLLGARFGLHAAAALTAESVPKHRLAWLAEEQWIAAAEASIEDANRVGADLLVGESARWVELDVPVFSPGLAGAPRELMLANASECIERVLAARLDTVGKDAATELVAALMARSQDGVPIAMIAQAFATVLRDRGDRAGAATWKRIAHAPMNSTARPGDPDDPRNVAAMRFLGVDITSLQSWPTPRRSMPQSRPNPGGDAGRSFP